MSDSVRPRPWDSPGKNTGVGCHSLLQCMKVTSESEVAWPCPTLANLPQISHGLHHCLTLCVLPPDRFQTLFSELLDTLRQYTLICLLAYDHRLLTGHHPYSAHLQPTSHRPLSSGNQPFVLCVGKSAFILLCLPPCLFLDFTYM